MVGALILIIVLAVTLSGSGSDPLPEVKAVSFEDAIYSRLYPKSKSLSWISSNSIILRGQDLVEVTVDKGDEKVNLGQSGRFTGEN